MSYTIQDVEALRGRHQAHQQSEAAAKGAASGATARVTELRADMLKRYDTSDPDELRTKSEALLAEAEADATAMTAALDGAALAVKAVQDATSEAPDA